MKGVFTSFELSPSTDWLTVNHSLCSGEVSTLKTVNICSSFIFFNNYLLQESSTYVPSLLLAHNLSPPLPDSSCLNDNSPVSPLGCIPALAASGPNTQELEPPKDETLLLVD